MPDRRSTIAATRWFYWICLIVMGLLMVQCGRASPLTLSLPSTPIPLVLAQVSLPPTYTLTPTPSPTLLPSREPTGIPSPTPIAPLSPPEPQPTPMATPTPLPAWAREIGLNQSGAWRYAANSFIHPRALVVIDQTAYLLDSGRVLHLDLRHPTPPQMILTTGQTIDGVPVLEPFDLSSDGQTLYVLDRAGDVYQYQPQSGLWQLDRYDRPVGDLSSQYYVALTAADETRFLLETSYKFVQAYNRRGNVYAWPIAPSPAVDMGVADGYAYVLTQGAGQVGQVAKVELERRRLVNWTVEGEVTRPRQLHATLSALYLLDQAGRRLQLFDPATGISQTSYTFTQPISTFWADDTRLILAGRDTLYFVNQPEKHALIPGGDSLAGDTPHDPQWLANLQTIALPIANGGLTAREFQWPGAPRHYRLGIHEGLDFYWAMGTPVQAVANGTVLRADLDYASPSERQFGQMRDQLLVAGYTPANVLDFYRGRQVWLQLDNGWVARYAHLSSIAPGIEPGTPITAGQILGQVGNSGSPSTQQDPNTDVHLHFELWLGDYYLGQFLHPIEIQEWLGIIFTER